MTIEYALTRTEAFLGFFRSLSSSPRYLGTILFYCAALSVYTLVRRGAFSRPFTIQDAATAFLVGIAFMLFLPVVLFIRAKTSKRLLTVSPEGISTEIGKIKGNLQWKQIKVITQTNRYVLISRGNGNAFFIPSRAFSNSEQQAEFVSMIKQWASIA